MSRRGGRPLRWAAGALALTLAAGLVSYRTELDPDTVEAEYADAGSRFAEVAGVRVHYKDEGEGPALLLVHGTAASLHTWDGWVAELADRFRIVRPDVLGYGLTGPDPGGDYSAARRVEVFVGLLDRLGIRRAHVAGNSLGGALALELAHRHPERVERLVLIDAAGYPTRRGGRDGGRGFVVFDLGRIPGLNVVVTRMTPRWLVGVALRQAYGEPARVTPELVDRYYRLLRRRGNRRALISGLATEHELDREAIRSIAAPALVMWGRRDRLIPVELAARFDADLPRSELLIYDGVGHVPMEEIPRRSARDAARFLRTEPAVP